MPTKSRSTKKKTEGYQCGACGFKAKKMSQCCGKPMKKTMRQVR